VKKGFTMLELIVVIAILGIVSSIGASAIADVYESYIVQRALHKSTIRTELATQQIATRLTYRIASSVVGREPIAGGGFKPIEELESLDANTYTALEWIGYDADSYDSQLKGGWSGIADTESVALNRTTIPTPASNLGVTAQIIAKLGGNIDDGVIVFAGGEYSPHKIYNAKCMGFGGDISCISPITGIIGDETIQLVDDVPKIVTDQYVLGWTAYAIVPENCKITPYRSCDLRLYYNYQPWKGESYIDGGSSLLAENITSFKYTGNGDTVRIKLCIREDIGMDIEKDYMGVCKEKAVIR